MGKHRLGKLEYEDNKIRIREFKGKPPKAEHILTIGENKLHLFGFHEKKNSENKTIMYYKIKDKPEATEFHFVATSPEGIEEILKLQQATLECEKPAVFIDTLAAHMHAISILDAIHSQPTTKEAK